MAKYHGYFIHIMPTSRCNLQCPYCYTNAVCGSKFSIMGEECIESVADAINRLEISGIHIEGGEPLLYPKLLDLVCKIREKDKIVIVTNGYLLTEQLIKELLKVGVNRFILSIDYPVRQMDVKKKSCVESLLELKKFNMTAEINVTLSRENIKFLEALFELASKNRVKRIRFGDIVPIGYAEKYQECILSARDYEMIIPQFYKLAQEYNITSSLSLHGSTFEMCSESFKNNYSHKSVVRMCDMTDSKLSIMPNGDIYTCFNLIDIEQFKIGNINEGMENVLSSIKYRTMGKCRLCPVGINYHLSFKYGVK